MMLRQTILVLALVACVLGSTLPLRRQPHTGPARGFALSRGRIYGGHDATKGEFPHQVSLQLVILLIKAHNCGGSIISESAILTAGHCKSGFLEHYEAVAGDHDLSTEEGTEQKVRVSEQIIHPDYPGNAAIAANDIAVFKLESPLTLGTYVKIINLPTADVVPEGGSSAVVSGWGSTETASTPDILQTVEVSVIDYTTCKQNIDDLNIGTNPLTDTMLCTGPIDQGISTCGGDSGGPLVQNNELIGVVSWGMNPCATKGAPSVFTRVSAHVAFVNQHI